MEQKVSVVHNREMETLDVWFDDPEKEEVSEEVGEGLILKKDSEGNVIGIEVLYFSKQEVPFEFKTMSGLAAGQG